MERSDHPRVVVVGGGIIGSAIAMHLAERGLRPLLVDEDRAGEAASARSFASLSAFGNDPVAYYELACAALASWSRWAKRLGEVGYRRGGELRWAADPQQGRELAEQVERARSRGYPIVPVDETDLRQLLPAAEPGPVAAACHAPWDGQVEADLVVAACRSATTAAGGRLRRRPRRRHPGQPWPAGPDRAAARLHRQGGLPARRSRAAGAPAAAAGRLGPARRALPGDGHPRPQ